MFKSKKLSLLLVFALMFSLITPILAVVPITNTGLHNAGSGISLNYGDHSRKDWSNPSHITGDDNNYAKANNINKNKSTEYLQGKNYNFHIPTSARISGIKVSINRMGDYDRCSEQGYLVDETVRLIKNGNLVGNNKAVTSTNWPTSFSVATYGGDSDLWGTSWTPAEINSMNFGVSLSAKNTSNHFNKDAYVDYMQITVYYIADTISPVIAEVTPVPNPTNDNTPDYTFSSTEAGTISYGGSCSSIITMAVVGSNTVTFNQLADGTYSDCTITVTDASLNISNTLHIAPFTVNTAPACTSQDYQYSDWGECIGNSQSRTLTNQPNCSGGAEPVLTQSCTPLCTAQDYQYTNWSDCTSDNTQSRTLTNNPSCSGGAEPVLTQGCEYVPPTRECAENDYEYGAWGECVANTQSRTFVKTGNCEGGFVPGETNLTQGCTP